MTRPVAVLCLIFMLAAGVAAQESPGYMPFTLGDKTGLKDRNGKQVIPAQFDLVGGYGEGLIAVAVGKQRMQHTQVVMYAPKWGFCDTLGNIVIGFKYDRAFPFSGGLARVEVGSRYGFIDQSGEYRIQPWYDDAGDFSGGFAHVSINFEDGAEHREGYLDKRGNEAIPVKYYQVETISEGMAAARYEKDGPWLFVDTTGREICRPMFASTGVFVEGRCSIVIDGKTGFIDLKGEIVVQPKYFSAGDFSKGRSLVKEKRTGPAFYIDRNGKEYREP